MKSDDNISQPAHKLHQALWRLYNRPSVPTPWSKGDGNLPWNDPDFSERMLREHLSQAHGAASRTDKERALQIDWLWEHLNLQKNGALLDMTCGPGLYAVDFAQRGCMVTGVDFSPASIRYAHLLAEQATVADRVTFYEQDVRLIELEQEAYDAAVFLYGQITVFSKADTLALLQKIAHSLKSHGRLCIEILDETRLDKKDSTWWHTGKSGLWGETPFLHLGERTWLAKEKIAVERFHVYYLESGESLEIELCDQSYTIAEMTEVLHTAGFAKVDAYPAWDQLPLYDKDEWVLFVAEK